ncbi:AlpA family phage regulatory protein [Paraburkholderia diazotrophica]|uniref:helix-turn-helix transcriptional regulator n=1 Tax=Paraburkholderia diazotrophica TaxID=667676 RepID=UPI003D1858FE
MIERRLGQASARFYGTQGGTTDFHAGGAKWLAQLSPSALAHWPTVAKQLSDAGVLEFIDGESLAHYCEAFAQWRAASDRLATLLIDLGLMAGRRAYSSAEPSHKPPTPDVTANTKPEPARRPPNAIMRRPEVENETGLSRSTIYQRIKAGTFPMPVQLGARSVGWRIADIEAFLSSPAGYKAAV